MCVHIPTGSHYTAGIILQDVTYHKNPYFCAQPIFLTFNSSHVISLIISTTSRASIINQLVEIIFKKRQTDEKRAANSRFEIRDYFVASDFPSL